MSHHVLLVCLSAETPQACNTFKWNCSLSSQSWFVGLSYVLAEQPFLPFIQRRSNTDKKQESVRYSCRKINVWRGFSPSAPPSKWPETARRVKFSAFKDHLVGTRVADGVIQTTWTREALRSLGTCLRCHKPKGKAQTEFQSCVPWFLCSPEARSWDPCSNAHSRGAALCVWLSGNCSQGTSVCSCTNHGSSERSRDVSVGRLRWFRCPTTPAGRKWVIQPFCFGCTGLAKLMRRHQNPIKYFLSGQLVWFFLHPDIPLVFSFPKPK